MITKDYNYYFRKWGRLDFDINELVKTEFMRGIHDAEKRYCLEHIPEGVSITGELTRIGKAYVLGHKLIEWEKDAEP